MIGFSSQSILLGLATLLVIILGLFVVFVTLFWPPHLWFVLTRFFLVQVVALDNERLHKDSPNCHESDKIVHAPFLSAIILVQIVRIYNLWTDPYHLAIFRSWIFLPLRSKPWKQYIGIAIQFNSKN
jgi:hypothetical protein